MRSRNPAERKARMFALASPVVLGGLIVAAAVILGLATLIPGSAEGERVEIRVRSSCPDAWSERLTQRATDVGIGDLEVLVDGDETVVTGVLPGLEDDLVAIPALLTRQADFRITGEGEELASDVDVLDTWLQMNIMGHPYVVLDLQPNAFARLQGIDSIDFILDGEVIGTQRADDGEIDTVELQPELDTIQAEVRAATDYKILLQHGPAPCVAEGVATNVVQ